MISKLKLIRESKGITQKELCEKAGIGLKTLQSYEQCVVAPENISLGKAVAIARVLGVSAEDLL